MPFCDCVNKFTGLETGDPQEESADLDEGVILLEVSLTRNCTECSTEKRSASYSFEHDISDEIKGHIAARHPEHDGDKMGAPSMTLDVDYEVDESGGGRYAKNMISVNANYTVTCDECIGDDAKIADGTITESMAASEFDEV